MRRSPLAAERGSVLVAVLFLIVLMAGLSLGLLDESMAERASVRHHETSLVAFELAELGLTQAEFEIRGTKDVDNDGLGTLKRTFEHGSFEVKASAGSAPDQLVLTSTGTQGLSRRTVEVVLKAQPSKPWDYGIIGRKSLYIRNDPGSYKAAKDSKSKDKASKDKKSVKRMPEWLEVDGYDSSLGTYAKQSLDPKGWPHMDEGRVASNGNVTLDGWVKVYGDAQAGPGGFSTQLIKPKKGGMGKGPEVTGSTTPLEAPLLLPDPPFADFETAYAANNNALVNGLQKSKVDGSYNAEIEGDKGPIVLPAGTYLFHELKIKKGVTLNVGGPVKIYVTGKLEVEDEVSINEKGRPGDVQIIAHPYKLPYRKQADTKAVIKLKTDFECAFALYAPERDFDWKDKQDMHLSGAVVGRNFEILSKAKDYAPKLHYDVSLSAIQFDFTSTQRLSWREISANPR